MNLVKEFQSFVLARELKKKQQRNPAISLRALALELGVSVSNVSRVINKERKFSPSMALAISQKLKLNEVETARFVYGKSFEKKLLPEHRSDITLQAAYEFIKPDTATEISEINRSFDVSEEKLLEILARLAEQGLIEIQGNSVVRLETTEPAAQLEEDDEDIDISSLVFPLAEENMKLAKEMIRNFNKEFVEIMGSKDSRAIYECRIQLTPLNKP